MAFPTTQARVEEAQRETRKSKASALDFK